MNGFYGMMESMAIYRIGQQRVRHLEHGQMIHKERQQATSAMFQFAKKRFIGQKDTNDKDEESYIQVTSGEERR